MHLRTYVRACVRACVRARACVCVCVCVYARMHVCVRASVCVCIYMYVIYVYTHERMNLCVAYIRQYVVSLTSLTSSDSQPPFFALHSLSSTYLSAIAVWTSVIKLLVFLSSPSRWHPLEDLFGPSVGCRSLDMFVLHWLFCFDIIQRKDWKRILPTLFGYPFSLLNEI
jgi:hypothetical protein